MRYMCTKGHMHRSQMASINCSYCRRAERKAYLRYMAKKRDEAEAALEEQRRPPTPEPRPWTT